MYFKQYLTVRITFLKSADFTFVHFDEAFLGQNIMKRILIEEYGLNELEKPLRIKLNEPFQELVCCYESHDIKDVHSPLKRGQ